RGGGGRPVGAVRRRHARGVLPHAGLLARPAAAGGAAGVRRAGRGGGRGAATAPRRTAPGGDLSVASPPPGGLVGGRSFAKTAPSRTPEAAVLATLRSVLQPRLLLRREAPAQ